jgi:hypothetical protein
MDTNSKRVHYYHADASALGGTLTRPINEIIPLQAPLSLSPAGGHATATANGADFPFPEIIKFDTAYTLVSGSLSPKPDHGWTTVVTAVVEGLNVLNVVTADRVVAQVSTDHPLEGYDPTVTFLGTEIDGLKIAGCEVGVDLDTSICDQGESGSYPSGPCISNRTFLSKAADQYRRMNDPANLPEWVTDRIVPDWIKQRYVWNNAQVAAKGGVVCSVVKGINGQFSGRPFGNVCDVPNFGRVFLGELLVDCKSYRLTMIRLELGCLADGHATFSTATINGHTQP